MIYNILLFLHIIAGTAALGGGLMAIIARKSKGLHTRSGIIFYQGMIGVAITAFVMTLIKFNPFLLSIGVFSLYLTYTGKMAIVNFRKKEKWESSLADKLPGYIALAVSAFMMAWPLVLMFLSGKIFVPILSVFGIILFLNAMQDIRFLQKTENLVPENKNFLIQHISKMGGAYIATVTAFLLNNISFQPVWIGWLLPTIVGTPLIIYSIRSWRAKLRIT
jgi:hypothetical protein